MPENNTATPEAQKVAELATLAQQPIAIEGAASVVRLVPGSKLESLEQFENAPNRRKGTVNLTTVDPALRNPYTHNWFLGVQREIGCVERVRREDRRHVGVAEQDVRFDAVVHAIRGERLDLVLVRVDVHGSSRSLDGPGETARFAGELRVADEPRHGVGRRGIVRQRIRAQHTRSVRPELRLHPRLVLSGRHT